MIDEYKAAITELEIAQNVFNNMTHDPDLIDAAIYRIQAAEKRVEAILKQIKHCSCTAIRNEQGGIS
jgi:uncharacterized protein YdcH (DUF465 family)